jgi:hypothetical protein
LLRSDGDLLLQEWGAAGKIDMMDYGGSLVTRAVMFCNQVTESYHVTPWRFAQCYANDKHAIVRAVIWFMTFYAVCSDFFGDTFQIFPFMFINRTCLIFKISMGDMFKSGFLTEIP